MSANEPFLGDQPPERGRDGADELMTELLGDSFPGGKLVDAQVPSLDNAWYMLNIAGGLPYVAVFEATMLIFTYLLIDLTDDESLWNYIMGFHFLMAIVAIFVGLWRHDPFAYALGALVIAFLNLFLDSVGIWWREEERMPGRQTEDKHTRKAMLLSVQCLLLVVSVVYIILLAILISGLKASPKFLFKGVDPGLTTLFYVFLSKKNVIRRLIYLNPNDMAFDLASDATQAKAKFNQSRKKQKLPPGTSTNIPESLVPPPLKDDQPPPPGLPRQPGAVAPPPPIATTQPDDYSADEFAGAAIAARQAGAAGSAGRRHRNLGATNFTF